MNDNKLWSQESLGLCNEDFVPFKDEPRTEPKFCIACELHKTGLVRKCKKHRIKIKTITNSQYLNIMNFFSTKEKERKRIYNLCKKFNIAFAISLPRSKYQEAMDYLNSGEWDKE